MPTTKWSPSVLAEGFVPFPKKLLRSLRELFEGETALADLAAVLAVIDFKRPNPTRKPSLEYLGFLAGLTESEFRDALRRLETLGYLTIQGDEPGLEIDLAGFESVIEKATG